MVKGQYTEISKENFKSLKKEIEGLEFDKEKLRTFIESHYVAINHFSSAMKEKYEAIRDTNLSFASASTVTNALKDNNPNLTAKLLLYLIVEDNIKYKDFIKEEDSRAQLQERVQILEDEKEQLQKENQTLKDKSNILYIFLSGYISNAAIGEMIAAKIKQPI